MPPGVMGPEAYDFDRHDFPDMVPPEFWRAREIWMRYRDGHLMYGGGIMDQPVMHGAIIGVFNGVYAHWRKYKAKGK